MFLKGVGIIAIVGFLLVKLVAVMIGIQFIVLSILLFIFLENVNIYISVGINVEVNCKVVGVGNF